MSARQEFAELAEFSMMPWGCDMTARKEARLALDLIDSQAAEITRLTSERDEFKVYRDSFAAARNELTGAVVERDALRAEVARLTEANAALEEERDEAIIFGTLLDQESMRILSDNDELRSANDRLTEALRRLFDWSQNPGGDPDAVHDAAALLRLLRSMAGAAPEVTP